MPGLGIALAVVLAILLCSVGVAVFCLVAIWAPRPTLGDFEIYEGWYGGADPVVRGRELEPLLREADRMAGTIQPGQRRMYFVIDRDDGERGWAQWADCGRHGTFDASGECERCEYLPREYR